MIDFPSLKQYINRNRKPNSSSSQSTPPKRKPLLVIFVGLLVLLALATAALYTLSILNYSDGQRIGIVRKLSNKGLIPTGEGELVLTGIRTERRNSSNTPAITGMTDVWEFSVAFSDSTTYKKLVAAMDSGTPVILEYKQRYFPSLQLTDTSYIITNIKPIGTSQ